MTESEKRRIELLRKTRNLYSDKNTPPAVHPRYQSFYTKLYQTENEAEHAPVQGTLGIRIFISVLLFAVFVMMDYKGAEYAEVDSKRIIQEIERKVDISHLDLL